MNKVEVRAKCDELLNLIGDMPNGSAEVGRKASMIANEILAAAPVALTVRAKSLREQLELWFGRGKLKTHKDIELCRQTIRDNMGMLEQHWDARRPRRPSPGVQH
jgi:ATP-dependent exoDNAse (exonuclease V) alpha subunit